MFLPNKLTSTKAEFFAAFLGNIKRYKEIHLNCPVTRNASTITNKC
jgi:hypothetical protein